MSFSPAATYSTFSSLPSYRTRKVDQQLPETQQHSPLPSTPISMSLAIKLLDPFTTSSAEKGLNHVNTTPSIKALFQALALNIIAFVLRVFL